MMAQEELSEDVAVLMAQMMKLSAQEALYWRERLARAVRESRVMDKDWAPRSKAGWDETVKVVDEQGRTAGFVDVSDATKLEKAQLAVDREDDELEVMGNAEHEVEASAGEEQVREFTGLNEQLLAARLESPEEREERLGGDEVAAEFEKALDYEFYALLDDPRFARLVEQERLELSDEGLWVVPEDSQLLSSVAGEHLNREVLLEAAEDAGWDWDGVPGVRPVMESSDVPVEFDSERDELVRLDDDFWMKVSEPESERELPVGEILTDGQAKEIAEKELGWQWVDEVDEVIEPDRPVVVSEARVEVDESVPSVVLADRYAWADGVDDDVVVSAVEEPVGAGQEGSTVPNGTVDVPSEKWDALAQEELNQQFHTVIEESKEVEHQSYWA